MAREPRRPGATDRSSSAAGAQTLEAPVISPPFVEEPSPLPFDLAETIVVPAVPRPVRRRRGRRRRFSRIARVLFVGVLVLTVLLTLGGVVAYEDPALLSPVGSVLLGSRPGLVPWNGHDPLNLLVMGVDQRTTESTRSDSMIVLHVDPSSHDVTMLSVPRDLWIYLPGYNNSTKINAGYALGQPYGQGPQFAQFAVESALRIPINYVAVLKFNGFKSVVDAMGGVNVCVPRELYDANYPDDTGFGHHTIDIKAGCQVMDGTTALVYARERHANAQQDLGRIEQQQAVVSGVEKGLLSPFTLVRLPAILTAADKAVDTTLPHAAALELGMLLARAGSAHMQHVYLNVDSGYVTAATSSDGQDILDPNWAKIRPEMISLFANPRLSNENASVQVLDGQVANGLAATYTTMLQNIGFNTIAPANAGTTSLQHSTVVLNLDHPGGDYSVRVLGQMLGVAPSSAHLGADQAQVVVTLGGDAVWGSTPP